MERNPETTFQALRYVIDSGFTSLEFHIMGHINDYTSQLIKKYSLQDYVKCIGSFSYMEALSKMQTYDILVLLEARLEKVFSLQVNSQIICKPGYRFWRFPQLMDLQ